MKNYKENDRVIYIDDNGLRHETFVIFDTEKRTGLTHIDYANLRVKEDQLKLLFHSSDWNHRPIQDPLSFELFKYLKRQYLVFEHIRNSATAVLISDQLRNNDSRQAS
ncbi:MAG: hypothetical protein ACOH2A_05450 [Sphingobacteriaceae bacterium]